MSKPIVEAIYDKEALEKLLVGAEKTAKAAVITLGPLGPNVALIDMDGRARTVNDGVTIADRLCFEDPYEDMARSLSVQAATETNISSGDGTTTSLLLNWQLVKESASLIFKGKNPLILRRELIEAKNLVLEVLKTYKKEVNSDKLRSQIAAVSSQDDETGKLISQAIEMAGEYGSVVVEESSNEGVTMKNEKGVSVDQGYASSYFITNPVREDRVELVDPLVLVTDQAVNTPSEVLESMAIAIQAKKPLLIVAEDFSTPVLKILTENNKGGVLRSCAIKSPGIGERKEEILQDIAFACGAMLISKKLGMELDKVLPASLGNIGKAIIGERDTKLIGTLDVSERVEQLNRELVTLDSKVEIKKLKERMAKLTGGLVIIRIGARTMSELNEKKLRMEDAVNATRVAVEHGAVPGGGIALLNSKDVLKGLNTDGSRVLYNVLSKPFEFILTNAGMNPKKVLKNIGKYQSYGMNVATGEYGNMLDLGIVDPLKVVQDSLENSISSATSIFSTACILVEKKL